MTLKGTTVLRFYFLLVTACWFTGFALQSITAQQLAQEIDFNAPGLSKTKPDSGFFVEIDGGYMVPYSAQVPRSNATFKMMPIPGGRFLMGSDGSLRVHQRDEQPQVEVVVEPFWMGQTEVTWGQYRGYMKLDRIFKELARRKIRLVDDDNRIDAVTAPSSLYDPSMAFDAGDGDNQPCALMTQYSAKQYSKFVSLASGVFYRLPTEAEWEYACRAGTTTDYYFGNDSTQMAKHAWYCENADDRRHSVARLEPNPWGLYDMYGNVSEWVLDQYVPDHYLRLDTMEIKAENAFVVPTELYPRVCRGGSFRSDAGDCRSASRAFSEAQWKSHDPENPASPWWFTTGEAEGNGFRLIRSLHVPDSREAMEAFWAADVEEINEAVDCHIFNSGCGAWGLVDKDLMGAIKALKKD